MDKRSDYLYNLPENLIAQEPLTRRDSSRLLVLNRGSELLKHDRFFNIASYLRKGDVLVINDTRVIPARLIGKRSTGGKVEIFLLRELEELTWECLVKPAKRLKRGQVVLFPGGVSAEIIEIAEEGRRIVHFNTGGKFHDWLEKNGQTPLPPYIKRQPVVDDMERYQTIYADHNGAVAAPTAGLHFADSIFDELKQKGIIIARITLHVGIGTFRPVSVEDLRNHVMDKEVFEVNTTEAGKINEAKQSGGRIIAVGTTVVRTLETVTNDEGKIIPQQGEANLFIRPPYRYKAVDALITNFHLPGSTLLMLVSALAGRDRILEAYDEAVREKYRFFSYGDAMLIL
ncbi:MAG: tRNA preQ1(34) S-adenosylmethionine ribosyltransferase-isomerase QueA [Candidatus Electryonea clarkiae]|nr:tRNA preQ1(34) S-adenosylmethionine ribosyltransferase-isomerase QueA [Candidatus Electryonea clarkiae]MDP8289077.1 tRNA preQ1(34) S-adenosylmethionine ribosyltransferase-isomerase QueA [Candidatus Electryonea clarkiae]